MRIRFPNFTYFKCVVTIFSLLFIMTIFFSQAFMTINVFSSVSPGDIFFPSKSSIPQEIEWFSPYKQHSCFECKACRKKKIHMFEIYLNLRSSRCISSVIMICLSPSYAGMVHLRCSNVCKFSAQISSRRRKVNCHNYIFFSKVDKVCL